MATVQHEPVAEEVVQFLPAPPPLPLVQPPSQHSQQLTYPSSWPLHCRHGVFFFLFPLPLSSPFPNRLTKALPFRRDFFFVPQRVLLVHTFSSKHTFYFNSALLGLFFSVCVPPSPPSLSLSSSPVSSTPRGRVCESARAYSSPPPPAGRAQEERMGALSLSLSCSFVSSRADVGAALWAVEEVRGSPGSPHSAVACRFFRRRPASLAL